MSGVIETVSGRVARINSEGIMLEEDNTWYNFGPYGPRHLERRVRRGQRVEVEYTTDKLGRKYIRKIVVFEGDRPFEYAPRRPSEYEGVGEDDIDISRYEEEDEDLDYEDEEENEEEDDNDRDYEEEGNRRNEFFFSERVKHLGRIGGVDRGDADDSRGTGKKVSDDRSMSPVPPIVIELLDSRFQELFKNVTNGYLKGKALETAVMFTRYNIKDFSEDDVIVIAKKFLRFLLP